MESWFKYGVRLQQDAQCIYNLTLRCVQVTIVAAENQSLLKILSVCNLWYLARKMHAPYYIFICNLSHSAVSFTLFEMLQYFKNNWPNILLFYFCTKCAWNIPYINKNWKYIIINAKMSACKLLGLLFSFERNLNVFDRLWEIIKY